MPDKQPGLDTIALHAGQIPDPTTGARALPLYQTTSYVFKDTQHAADLFALRAFGNIYTRLMNPTTDVLEKRLAAMLGGTGAVCTASGQAAVFYAIANIASAGQNIVTGSNLYGGTYTMFTSPLKRFGIEARFVDSSKAAELRKGDRSRTLACSTPNRSATPRAMSMTSALSPMSPTSTICRLSWTTPSRRRHCLTRLIMVPTSSSTLSRS